MGQGKKWHDPSLLSLEAVFEPDFSKATSEHTILFFCMVKNKTHWTEYFIVSGKIMVMVRGQRSGNVKMAFHGGQLSEMEKAMLRGKCCKSYLLARWQDLRRYGSLQDVLAGIVLYYSKDYSDVPFVQTLSRLVCWNSHLIFRDEHVQCMDPEWLSNVPIVFCYHIHLPFLLVFLAWELAPRFHLCCSTQRYGKSDTLFSILIAIFGKSSWYHKQQYIIWQETTF